MEEDYYSDEFDSSDGEDEVRRRVDDFYYSDSHLNSALNNELTTRYLTGEKLEYREKRCFTVLERLFPDLRFWSNCVQKLIKPIFWDISEGMTVSDVAYKEGFRLARKLIDVSICQGELDWNGFAASDMSLRFRTLSEWLKHANEVRMVYRNQTLRKKIDSYELAELDTGSLMMSCIFTDDVVAIKVCGYKVITSHEGFMMICDTVHQRALALDCLNVTRWLKDEMMPSEKLLLTVWKKGDALLNRVGNEAYKAIKMWEPLINGRLISLDESGILNSRELYDTMTKEYNTLLHGWGYMHLSVVPDINGVTSPEILSEICGLQRLWGHPETFVDMAIEKNKSKSMKFNLPDKRRMNLVEAKFKQMICESFYDKNDNWPFLDYSLLVEKSEHKNQDPIAVAIMSGNRVDTLDSRYNQINWRFVIGRPNFVDKHRDLNPLSIINDKACSPTRDELRNKIRDNGRITWDKRRVLARFLAEDQPDPYDFLNEVDKSGLSVDDLYIGLSPKERELNHVPRLFSLMPMKLKMYFGCTEMLLAEHILPLIEECTMTDTLPQLKEKFLQNMANNYTSDNYSTVTMSKDFEKWNLQMRHENTYPMFKFLDELFGFNHLFSSTHKIFESVTFYYDHHVGARLEWDNEIDNIKEGPRSWRNNRGGCEGLRQKGWTLVTIALLKSVLDPLGHQFKIFGQGDNQVSVFKIKPSSGNKVSNYTDEDKKEIGAQALIIKDAVIKVSKEFCLPLKPEETWLSTSFFNYGKEMYYRGRQLRMSLKRLCRMFPYSNEDYPTLMSSLTSASALTQAAIAQYPSVYYPLVFSIMELRRIIKRHLNYSLILKEPLLRGVMNHAQFRRRKKIASLSQMHKAVNEKQDEIIFSIMLGCNNLGGSPVSTLFDSLCRGTADPVTLQLTYLQHLIRTGDLTHSERCIATNLSRPIISEKEDLTLLFQDPLSINIESGTTCKNVLKRAAGRVLSSEFVQNSLIKGLNALDTQDSDKIVEFLSTIEPFCPIIAADAYAVTVSGQRANLLARFETTRTVTKCTREAGESLSTKLRNSELSTVTGWLIQCFMSGDHINSDCTTKQAQFYRDKWGKEVVGVTTPFFAHSFILNKITGRSLIRGFDERIMIYLSTKSLISLRSLFKELGPANAYVGSETKEKISQSKEWEVKSVPSALRAASRIMRIVGWFVDHDSNIAEFLRRNLACFSDVDPSYFTTIAGSVTGNFIHRYHDAHRSHTGYLPIPSTAATHMTISTNSMGSYAKGSGNYAIHFQGIIVGYLTKIISDLYSGRNCHGVNDSVEYSINLNCSECYVPLMENHIDCTGKVPELTKLPEDNPLYTNHQSIETSLLTRYKLNNSLDIDAYKIKKGEDITYTLIARTIIKSIFSSRENRFRLPINWFFEIDIRKLMEYTRQEGLIAIMADKISSLRFDDSMDRLYDDQGREIRTCVIDEDTLEQEYLARISGMKNSDFGSVISMFDVAENLEAISYYEESSEVTPASYPPSRSMMRQVVKSLLLCKWKKVNPLPVYCIGDLTPYKMLYHMACKYLLLCRQDVLQFQELMTLIHAKLFVKSTIHNPGNTIDKDTLMNSLIHGHLKYSHHTRLLAYGVSGYINANTIFYPYAADKMIKEIKTTRVADDGMCKIRLRIKARYPCDFIGLKKEGWADYIEPEKIKQSSYLYRKYLLTSHGPCLLNLMIDEDKVDSWGIIGDGAGGTSLALSGMFPSSKIVVYPYVGQGDLMNDMLSMPPPEIRKNNPCAYVKCADDRLIDMSSPMAFLRLQDLKEDKILVDMDCNPEDYIKWIKNICEADTSKLFYVMLYGVSSSGARCVAGMLGNGSRIKEVRRGTIRDVLSWMIIIQPEGKFRCDLRIPNYIFLERSMREFDYSELEEKLVRDLKMVQNQVKNNLSHYGNSEIGMLLRLTNKPYSIFRSRFVRDTSRNIVGILTRAEASKAIKLLLIMSQCGKYNERWENIKDTICHVKYLYYCIDGQSPRGCLTYRTAEDLIETRRNLIKFRRATHDRTPVYMSFYEFKSLKSNVEFRLNREMEAYVDQGEHVNCNGTCWTKGDVRLWDAFNVDCENEQVMD